MKRLSSSAAVLSVSCVVALGISIGSLTAGQQPESKGKAEDTAQTARGAADKDPNVKTATGVNDPAKEMPAPPQKGGPQTRGRGCYITYDNYTPWYIEAFLDGQYCGTVAPYGELDCVTGDGWTVLYARARFTDGSMKYWGPRRGMCVNESFNWQLRR